MPALPTGVFEATTMHAGQTKRRNRRHEHPILTLFNRTPTARALSASPPTREPSFADLGLEHT